jgi:hypothetical protein
MPWLHLSSTLSATRSNVPDMTFEWRGIREFNELKVEVKFGGGNATDNVHSIKVPWRSIQQFPFNGGSSAINVQGEVRVFWGADDSYVVMFSGDMIRGNVNNIIGRPVIVCAYLSHTTAEADESE